MRRCGRGESFSPSRRHPAGISPQQAYLDLQKLARAQGRNTQQLFEFYIHERFLARLAESRFSEMFVLKGGMLLAVLDVRRPTRDAGSDSPTQGDNAIYGTLSKDIRYLPDKTG